MGSGRYHLTATGDRRQGGLIDDTLTTLGDPLTHGDRGSPANHAQDVAPLGEDRAAHRRVPDRMSRATVVSSPLPSDEAQRAAQSARRAPTELAPWRATSWSRSSPKGWYQGSSTWELPSRGGEQQQRELLALEVERRHPEGGERILLTEA